MSKIFACFGTELGTQSPWLVEPITIQLVTANHNGDNGSWIHTTFCSQFGLKRGMSLEDINHVFSRAIAFLLANGAQSTLASTIFSFLLFAIVGQGSLDWYGVDHSLPALNCRQLLLKVIKIIILRSGIAHIEWNVFTNNHLLKINYCNINVSTSNKWITYITVIINFSSNRLRTNG